MLRAPFSLEKMSYEPASGVVIYRSRMHKTLTQLGLWVRANYGGKRACAARCGSA
jgi:hypothetical protein